MSSRFLKFLIFSLLLSFLFSCQFVGYIFGGKRKIHAQGHLQEYLKNIPQEESVNASLYNYELFVHSMKIHLEKGENQKVGEKFREYLKTFFEGEPEDQSEVYFLAAQAIKNILRNDEEKKKLFAIRDRRFSQYLRTLYYFPYLDYQGVSSKRKGLVLLQNDEQSVKANKQKKSLNEANLFWQIVLMRENYVVEQMALKKVFLSNFLPITGDKSCQHNLNYLYWSVTRYPDSWKYRKILQDSTFLPQTDAEKKKCRFAEYDQKIDLMEKVLTSQQPKRVFQEKIWAFVYPYGAVLRNRPDKLSSRNVIYIQAWQPLLILSEHIGEDEKKWFRVQHKNNRLFLPADTSLKIVKSRHSASLAKQHSNITFFSGLKNAKSGGDSMQNSYFQCYQLFSQKNYLQSIKCLVELKEKDEKIFAGPAWEFFLVLLYKNLEEIGLRATAHKNKYMNFVKKYPFYFVVDEKNYNLYPSDFLLKQLLEKNPHSPMFQYFEFLSKNTISPQSKGENKSEMPQKNK